jgi:hypothetical protein
MQQTRSHGRIIDDGAFVDELASGPMIERRQVR